MLGCDYGWDGVRFINIYKRNKDFDWINLVKKDLFYGKEYYLVFVGYSG